MSEGSGRLECSACCNNIVPKTQFSSNQRKKSATRRKCLECIKSSPVQTSSHLKAAEAGSARILGQRARGSNGTWREASAVRGGKDSLYLQGRASFTLQQRIMSVSLHSGSHQHRAHVGLKNQARQSTKLGKTFCTTRPFTEHMGDGKRTMVREEHVIVSLLD